MSNCSTGKRFPPREKKHEKVNKNCFYSIASVSYHHGEDVGAGSITCMYEQDARLNRQLLFGFFLPVP